MIKQPKAQGFSLVETLVAISILLIALVGPLTIAARSAQGTTFANESIVAFFLAQEGAELAQKIRDDYALQYLEQFNSGTTPGSSPWEEYMNRTVGDPYERCFNHLGNSTDNSYQCSLEIQNPGGGAAALIAAQNCRTTAITNCRVHYRSPNGGQRTAYTHDSSGSSEPTPYTRTIQIVERVADQEAEVVSQVTWRSGFLLQPQQVEVRTTVFNIYEQ